MALPDCASSAGSILVDLTAPYDSGEVFNLFSWCQPSSYTPAPGLSNEADKFPRLVSVVTSTYLEYR